MHLHACACACMKVKNKYYYDTNIVTCTAYVRVYARRRPREATVGIEGKKKKHATCCANIIIMVSRNSVDGYVSDLMGLVVRLMLHVQQ